MENSLRFEMLEERSSRLHVALLACLGLCGSLGHSPYAGAQAVSDEALQQRVEAALVSASDLPANAFEVDVSGGIVTLSGSVVCESCGGSSTPAAEGTVQQSLGAIIRAVPGVQRVVFDLRYQAQQ